MELDRSTDEEAVSWLLDRRDFVAAERDRTADERERSAQRRDEAADMREDLAEKRERDIYARERSQQGGQATARGGGVRLTPAAQKAASSRARRAQDRERRIEAVRGREAAAAQRRHASSAWGPQAYGPRLLASFAELAGRLFIGRDPGAELAQALDHVVAVMPHCDAVGLTMWRGSALFDTLATDAAAASLENVQFVSGEGPAWQAMEAAGSVHAQAADPRWPAVAAAASTLQICEMLSFAITAPSAGPPLGAFTMYSGTPGAFGEDEREIAAILAAYLSVAVATVQRTRAIERREASLHRALDTRDVIGQAKGILMERQGLSASEAFDVLRRASQRLNMRLTDIAEHLAESGSFPHTPRPAQEREADS